jgi:hypothetical protein
MWPAVQGGLNFRVFTPPLYSILNSRDAWMNRRPALDGDLTGEAVSFPKLSAEQFLFVFVIFLGHVPAPCPAAAIRCANSIASSKLSGRCGRVKCIQRRRNASSSFLRSSANVGFSSLMNAPRLPTLDRRLDRHQFDKLVGKPKILSVPSHEFHLMPGFLDKTQVSVTVLGHVFQLSLKLSNR